MPLHLIETLYVLFLPYHFSIIKQFLNFKLITNENKIKNFYSINFHSHGAIKFCPN